jgi:alanine-synthesizing transaminase
MEEFHKVRRLPPYVFEQVNRLKASARAGGADIIDLGMGNPDLPTPKAIVDKLCEVVQDPRTHRYSSSKGIPGLRRAQAAYYARRFGVKLNPIPRWWRRWAPRKASPTWRRRSPRPAT